MWILSTRFTCSNKNKIFIISFEMSNLNNEVKN